MFYRRPSEVSLPKLSHVYRSFGVLGIAKVKDLEFIDFPVTSNTISETNNNGAKFAADAFDGDEHDCRLLVKIRASLQGPEDISDTSCLIRRCFQRH